MSVLVIGDLMIDRSWVVRESDSATSQHHGDILAQRLLDSGARTAMFGGSGTVARRLVARSRAVVLRL
jgi:hypothetical protein